MAFGHTTPVSKTDDYDSPLPPASPYSSPLPIPSSPPPLAFSPSTPVSKSSSNAVPYGPSSPIYSSPLPPSSPPTSWSPNLTTPLGAHADVVNEIVPTSDEIELGEFRSQAFLSKRYDPVVMAQMCRDFITRETNPYRKQQIKRFSDDLPSPPSIADLFTYWDVADKLYYETAQESAQGQAALKEPLDVSPSSVSTDSTGPRRTLRTRRQNLRAGPLVPLDTKSRHKRRCH